MPARREAIDNTASDYLKYSILSTFPDDILLSLAVSNAFSPLLLFLLFCSIFADKRKLYFIFVENETGNCEQRNQIICFNLQ